MKVPKNKAKIIEDISHDRALISGDITTALNKIGELCARTLNIEEVAFWQFTQNGENLICIASHKAGRKTPTKTKQVSTRDIKDYIKTMQNGLYMVPLDASHKADKSAVDFLRKEIKASLHIPIYIGSALSGVVQFNQLKVQRDWDLSDYVFACQVTDLAADTIQNFGMKGNEKYIPEIMEMLNLTLDHILKELDLSHGMIRLDEIPITRGYSPEVEMEFVNQ
jgi:transcriptional regulator with GAF, ATPase, and Fis domain